MSTWVYKCENCEKTSVHEVESDQAPADEIECPHCAHPHAAKVFEIPEARGGCSCGGGKCC